MTLDIVKAIAGLSPESVQIHSEQYEKISEQLNGLYRDLVMDEYRIDVLVEMILGFKPEPHHIQMMEWQTTYQEGLLLGWRGAAKTTFCTVARCLFEILHNPDIRILIVSDATDQAKIMLRQIKSHLKSNEKFISVFGDWTTGASLWSETEITVNRRKAHHGEPTVMVAGIGTALPSRHFDLIIADDLVTEDNSQTEGQRQKVHDYFYKTLFPTLESPYGRLYAIGTRSAHVLQLESREVCLPDTMHPLGGELLLPSR